MSFALTWLPKALLDAGLKVAEVPGWEDRGRAEMGLVMGVICHHTAGPLKGNMPTLRTLVEGRDDLAGPLSQLGLGRDGTFYVVAAGRCNHAGAGSWRGITTGNSSFIGIEAENTGTGERWPDVQMDAYRRGVAAILNATHRPVDFCVGHKEWAPGRKDDPDFDMGDFRLKVNAIMSGQAPAPVLIPAVETQSDSVPNPRPTLRRGDVNDLVKIVQAKCQVAADGIFGATTEAAVREFQRKAMLVPDGIVGPKTWRSLDAVPAP